MFKPVIYNTNPVKLCIVNLHLLRTKSLKSICHKGNTVMYFIVTNSHLQMSCYCKQESGAEEGKVKAGMRSILLTGFRSGSNKEM